MNQYTWVLIGTGITFFATALGASLVFFVKGIGEKFQKICFGFASGVMVAAAVWSLLLPAFDMAKDSKVPSVVQVVAGFVLGGVFLFALDKIIPHMHPGENEPEGLKSNFKRSTMLVTSVTLHNIPEGMAVGLAFSGAVLGNGTMTIAGALALTFGMAIQNFPEGAAVSLPLRQAGATKKKAFFLGSMSGAVEIAGGMLMVLLANFLIPVMPYLLSFAAGAMIYVVVEELIPQSHSGGHSNIGVIAFMTGFVLMMVLDVVLG